MYLILNHLLKRLKCADDINYKVTEVVNIFYRYDCVYISIIKALFSYDHLTNMTIVMTI